MRLCIDIGSNHVKCALFDGQKRLKVFHVHTHEELKKELGGITIDHARLVCNNLLTAHAWVKEIALWGIAIQPILCDNFLTHVDPSNQDLLLPDTIAKIYGALSLYPINDCLIVDFGTTVRYELVTKHGKLLGRSTFPFFGLLYESLHMDFQRLGDQIPAPLGLNPIESINSGCYFGLLGSVERMIAEIRHGSNLASELITVATGALTEKASWKNPLSELVDHIHPYLVLEGLNQIINEGTKS